MVSSIKIIASTASRPINSSVVSVLIHFSPSPTTVATIRPLRCPSLFVYVAFCRCEIIFPSIMLFVSLPNIHLFPTTNFPRSTLFPLSKSCKKRCDRWSHLFLCCKKQAMSTHLGNGKTRFLNMASHNKSLRAHKQRRYIMEAAYLVYSSCIAALGEKLRRARQGMFPCQALRSFSFLLFQSTGIPDSHSVAKSTNSVGAPIFLLCIFTKSLACGMVKASIYAR